MIIEVTTIDVEYSCGCHKRGDKLGLEETIPNACKLHGKRIIQITRVTRFHQIPEQTQ